MQVQQGFNPHLANSIFQVANSPQYLEGIFLVKRISTAIPSKEHFGFVVSGKFLRSFDLSGYKAKVIHKVNTGVFQESYDPRNWQVIHKMSQNEIPMAVLRAKLTLNDRYDLLSDNCEHFARFVTTGRKESLQVQSAIGWAAIGLATYLWFRDDN